MMMRPGTLVMLVVDLNTFKCKLAFLITNFNLHNLLGLQLEKLILQFTYCNLKIDRNAGDFVSY